MATIAVTPYSLKKANLDIGTDDFTAAISRVEFTPSTSSSTWRGIGGNVLTDQSIAEWSCTIGLAQDLSPTGFMRYLITHEGESKEVVFTPVEDGPAIEATLVISPSKIGGAAGDGYATAEVTLAVVGKPQFVDVP